MEDLTPGRKLILDLLAKSVAKIQAAEAEKVEDVKTDGRKQGMKRESIEVPEKFRKKIKARKIFLKSSDIKAGSTEYKDKEEKKVKNENKVEKVKLVIKDKMHMNVKVEIKSKNRNRKVKVKKDVETPRTPFKIKTENAEIKAEEKAEFTANIVKNENKKDIIKGEIESKIKSDTFVIKKKPVEQNLRKKYLNLKSDRTLKETTTTAVRIKREYTGVKTDEIDVDKEDAVKKEMSLKKEYPRQESGITPLKGEKSSFKDKLKGVPEDFDNAENDGDKHPKSKHYRKSTSGKGYKRFTPEEDAILFQAMEHSGGKLNFQEISKNIPGRHPSSIINRVYLLKKTGKTKMKYTFFTLAEDLVTLAAVLKHLDEQSLQDLNLPHTDWVKVADHLGRERFAPRKRWEYRLKPWILQHYSGTLNLDIKRPLANFVSDHFKDVNSIDWSSVLKKPLFAGHTEVSLRSKLSELKKSTERHICEGSEVTTLEMIAEFANTKYVHVRKKVSETELKRQKEIIDYFESYVELNGINNFL